MSQSDLAEVCGISFQQIQKYERGGNRISFSRLTEIATALGMSVTELIEPLSKTNGKVNGGPRVEYMNLLGQPHAIEFLECLTHTNDKNRKALLGMMRAMADTA